MISIEEINAEIDKLLSQPSSYAQIERLSWLYIVRDHLSPEQKTPHGDSEFMRACGGKPVCDVMAVMDELMDTLLIIHPKLYNAVMENMA